MSPLLVLLIAWPVSEIVLGVARRGDPTRAHVSDRGSAVLLWSVIGLSVTVALLLQSQEWGRIGMRPSRLGLLALVVLVVGLIVRWTAILTLGRLFNTTVSVQSDHRIVRRGLYRRVRHPSYSGLLLAFVALGLSFGSWLSLAVIVVPVCAALLYRIRIEEGALLDAFGPEYSDYMAATKRLIPWVY